MFRGHTFHDQTLTERERERATCGMWHAFCSEPGWILHFVDWNGCCCELESRWYRPEDHFEHLLQYAQALDGRVAKIYSVLDLFGASQRVANTWIRNGYSAVAFDIKISANHDICTEAGFKELLSMAMQRLVLILWV